MSLHTRGLALTQSWAGFGLEGFFPLETADLHTPAYKEGSAPTSPTWALQVRSEGSSVMAPGCSFSRSVSLLIPGLPCAPWGRSALTVWHPGLSLPSVLQVSCVGHGAGFAGIVAGSWAVGPVSSLEHGARCFPRICPGICVGRRLSSVCFLVFIGKLIPKV